LVDKISGVSGQRASQQGNDPVPLGQPEYQSPVRVTLHYRADSTHHPVVDLRSSTRQKQLDFGTIQCNRPRAARRPASPVSPPHRTCIWIVDFAIPRNPL
jgi:hypothetical protein